jgi:hypothetical protein
VAEAEGGAGGGGGMVSHAPWSMVGGPLLTDNRAPVRICFMQP